MYRCSSLQNFISSSNAIRKGLQTFGSAPTSLRTCGGRLRRRCFLEWCTQFQITHVFLEAVLILSPANFLKTCESLFGVAPRARRLRGTASPSAFDASSFSRLDPLRRRMNRRPRLDSASDKVFFTAASPLRRRGRAALPAPGGARGRRAPLVVHDGALRARAQHSSLYPTTSRPLKKAPRRS